MFELSIRFNDGYAAQFLSEDDLTGLKTQVSAAHKTLNDRSGLGNDFLGWADLPVDYDKEEFARIKKAAEKIISDTDVFIVIGIGGSYLGARYRIPQVTALQQSAEKNTGYLFFRQQHKRQRGAGSLKDLRGQARFGQCYFKVGNHHRTGYRVQNIQGIS